MELLKTSWVEDTNASGPQDTEENGERSNKSITVKELQALVVSWGHRVSKNTIRRHLNNHSLIGRVARRKPFLTTRHRRKRFLEFAKRN